LGACQQGIAQPSSAGAFVISVVRSAAWGGGEEGVWPVEVPPGSSVAQLKEKIEELYEVPCALQKLCQSDGVNAQVLEDSLNVESFHGRRVYLLPEELPMEQQEEMAAAALVMGGLRESMETAAAVEESLQGVQYKVYFERPADAGGKAAGRKVLITLDALTPVSEVQQLVEMELFGAVDVEPAFLVYEDRLMPDHLTLYHAGVDENRKTVVVAKERPPPTQEEQMLMQMLAGAINDGEELGTGNPSGGRGPRALNDRDSL